MGAITRLKSSVASKLELLAEVAGLTFSISGATVAVVFGKLVVGIALGAVAFGFVLRLNGRARQQGSTQPHKAPAWVRPAAALLAVAEVAALVEATDLPVRFHQVGFQYAHWALVVLALLAAYWLQVGVLTSWARKRVVSNAA